MSEPKFLSSFWWVLVYLTIILAGISLVYGIYRYYNKRTQRKLSLVDPETAEVKVYREIREVNLTMRWIVLTGQTLLFVAVPILLILKTGISYEYYMTSRTAWLGATILYVGVVDIGGIVAWGLLALQLTMNNEAFESITKRRDGTVAWHQWFVSNETPLTRAQVEVEKIDNKEISEALKTYDNKLKDSTKFKIGPQNFWLTFMLADSYDYDAVVIATRHPWGEAWIRVKKKIYARSLPLPARLSMAKFREYGMITVVMPYKHPKGLDGETREFKLQMVPLLFATTDDRDDLDSFRTFQIAIKEFGAEEFMAAQIGGVTPSTFGLEQRLHHVKIETKRQLNAANMREETRNKANDAMAKLQGITMAKPKAAVRDWALLVMVAIASILFGALVVSRLVYIPFQEKEDAEAAAMVLFLAMSRFQRGAKAGAILPDELFETLRQRIAWERERYTEAKEVTWEQITQAQIFGMFGFIGDTHGPTKIQIQALVSMFNISYWQASLYRDAEWAWDKYQLSSKNQKEDLLKQGIVPEDIPFHLISFENWFLNKYRNAWIAIMKGALTNIVACSPTFAERREQRLETQAAVSTLAGASVQGPQRATSTLGTPSGLDFEKAVQEESERNTEE